MAGSFTQLLYHFVFSTKQRTPLITPTLRDPLHAYITGIIQSQRATLLQIGGMPDHVHILARLHQDTSISEFMRVVKSNSSKWINEQLGNAQRFEWQGGYGAFTVSQSICETVLHYIQNQEEHHKTLTFQEEFLLFLKRHEIDFDPKYIWD